MKEEVSGSSLKKKRGLIWQADREFKVSFKGGLSLTPRPFLVRHYGIWFQTAFQVNSLRLCPVAGVVFPIR